MNEVNIISLNATESLTFDIGVVEDTILYIIISAVSLAFIIVVVILAVMYKKFKAKTNFREFSRYDSDKKGNETADTDEHVYELIHDYANEQIFANDLPTDEPHNRLLHLNHRLQQDYITPL
ncbi:hypothetical protein Btru_072648 [Bulinus truncatus]|nr:hypothetical protein Btru_072648 [Bulinus truncatus]